MLTVDNVSKKYGNVEILKCLTLEISPGEIMALVGPSGCGKTTLLRIIAGLENPDEGRVLIDGTEVSTKNKLVAPNKRSLSMIFQDLALWPHMTVEKNIEFVIKRDKLTRNNYRLKIDEILANVNLYGYNNRYPHELSGGERQRLAIARALASKPVYLLMDEPFSSLDTILKGELQDMVIELKNNFRIGIIYVTHNIEEVFVLADRIAIINKGIMEQIDYKEKVLNYPKNEFVRRLLKIR